VESFHKNVYFQDINVYKILIDDYPLRRIVDILNIANEATYFLSRLYFRSIFIGVNYVVNSKKGPHVRVKYEHWE
jgi:hypothetical protein